MKGRLTPTPPSCFFLEPNTHCGGIGGDPTGVRADREGGWTGAGSEQPCPGGQEENAGLEEHTGHCDLQSFFLQLHGEHPDIC